MRLHTGCTYTRKRVCTESWLWEKNPLPPRGIEPASAAWPTDALTNWATSPSPSYCQILPLLQLLVTSTAAARGTYFARPIPPSSSSLCPVRPSAVCTKGTKCYFHRLWLSQNWPLLCRHSCRKPPVSTGKHRLKRCTRSYNTFLLLTMLCNKKRVC